MGARAPRALLTRRLLPVLVAAGLALALPAGAAPPEKGVFVPGASLGGLELGMTQAQVRQAWGGRFGVCRDCARPTWYFNYRPFEPKGAAVVFRRGRVAHVFTLWQPDGWRTRDGRALGEPREEVEDGLLVRDERRCDGYTAILSPGRGSESVFYVYRDRLWGFGLIRPGGDPCL